jgi:hypothetical protein
VSKFRQLKKLAAVACAAFAVVLVINAPSEAAGGGHSGGPSSGHFDGHPGFDAHHGFEGHHGFDRHHDFDGRFRGGFVYPYYGYSMPYYDSYPAYNYDAPSYYWYCPSYGAYYPSVDSCPSAWQPVPAS